MPSCAPLAVGYVPFQQTGSQRYDQREALSNGTLFPGLNLPFHLMVRGSNLPNGNMADLQALCFVIQELALYLDTHPDDAEAFALFKQYTAMEKSAKEAYENANGPIKRSSAARGDRYTWLQDPWPWNFEHNEVK
ncbi:MAG: spore coat protein CotJB [Oscillospiraceae bacterium]|nr:spore coat protein CotJB [Oscillospiraceae bacterium]